jgi:hypothetical protein
MQQVGGSGVPELRNRQPPKVPAARSLIVARRQTAPGAGHAEIVNRL